MLAEIWANHDPHFSTRPKRQLTLRLISIPDVVIHISPNLNQYVFLENEKTLETLPVAR